MAEKKERERERELAKIEKEKRLNKLKEQVRMTVWIILMLVSIHTLKSDYVYSHVDVCTWCACVMSSVDISPKVGCY